MLSVEVLAIGLSVPLARCDGLEECLSGSGVSLCFLALALKDGVKVMKKIVRLIPHLT